VPHGSDCDRSDQFPGGTFTHLDQHLITALAESGLHQSHALAVANMPDRQNWNKQTDFDTLIWPPAIT
jgi:hypothetical protein